MATLRVQFINKKFKILPNVVVASYLLCAIAQYFLGSLVLRERYIIIGYSPLLLYLFRGVPARIQKPIVFLFFISIFGSLFTFINHGFPSIIYLVHTFIQLSIVVLIFKNKISEQVPLFIFFAFCVLVFYQYSILDDINEIFPESSRNTVSWIGLVLCGMYYLLSALNMKGVKSPIPLFVLFILCVFSQGRSGILVSLMLLIAHYLFNFQNNRKLWVQVSQKLLLLLLFLGVILNYYSTFEERLDYLNDKKLESEGRYDLLQSYVNSIDYVTIFTGVSLKSIPVFKSYNYNPHNSYITCHINFGFMALFMYAFLIFALIKGMMNKAKYFITSIYLCIILRVLTDKLVFVGNFDYLIYFSSVFIIAQTQIPNKMFLRCNVVNPTKHEMT